MQRADARVGVPRALGTITMKDFSQAVSLLGKML